MVEIFTKYEYEVENDKNLFKNNGGERILIKKLRKAPYDIIRSSGKDYLMDKFGDCYVIEEDKFLFGILGSPLFFEVKNERIYALDTYGRVWVCSTTGEIIRFVFTRSPFKIVVEGESLVVFEEKSSSCENRDDGRGGKRVIGLSEEPLNDNGVRKCCRIVNDADDCTFDLDFMLSFEGGVIKYSLDGSEHQKPLNKQFH